MARKDALLSLRETLVTRRDALRMALTGDMSLLNELASQASGDVVDCALDAAHSELGSQLAEVQSRELGMIENASKRMKKASMGFVRGADPISLWHGFKLYLTPLTALNANVSPSAKTPRAMSTRIGHVWLICPATTCFDKTSISMSAEI